MTRYIVVFTGVGSVVGKAMLDSLEGRRENLHIVGTTDSLTSAHTFRCDEAFLTRASEDARYPAALAEIISQVKPDLVIPACDADVTVVAELGVVSTTGSPEAAEIGADKWVTWQFATDSELPIIPTALASQAEFPPPAIAKPRCGSGSRGVRVLLNDRACQRARELNDYVVQPLVGPVPEVIDPDEGVPLFWSAQVAKQGGVQGIIGPDGEIGLIIAFETVLNFGQVRRQWLSDDGELLALGNAWLRALAARGWRGPLNVSCVHDGHQWLLMELNPRFTGGTSSRTLCGADELGWTINRWAGRQVVPPLQSHTLGQAVFEMEPTMLRSADVEKLRAGHWSTT